MNKENSTTHNQHIKKKLWESNRSYVFVCSACDKYWPCDYSSPKTSNKGEETMTEEEFLKSYKMSDYASVAVTVDLNIFTIRNGQLCLLLIRRGGHPEKGKWALPGGFVNTDESLDTAAARELFEETNVKVEDGYLEQLKTYGDPGRDPRGYVVSTAYVALIPNIDKPVAGDDAADAHFFPIQDIFSDDPEVGLDLAFDHEQIVLDALERVRAKLEYSRIALNFIDGDSFTMSELRNVYEIVWNQKITPSNFRRKIQSVPNLVVPIGEKRKPELDGSRTSDLYKIGNAEEIYPPFRRSQA